MNATEAKARELAARLLGAEQETPQAPPSLRATEEEEERLNPAALLRFFDYGRSTRVARWFDGALRAQHAAADALTQRTEAGSTTDALTEMLIELHRLLLTHPVAMKAAFRALVNEGRSHAKTPEGHALRDRLLRSPKMRSASLLFRSLSMGILNDDDSTVLPSTYVDTLVRLIDEGNIEAVLARLSPKRPPT